MFQRGEVRNPVMIILLSYISCGLFGLYYLWNYLEDLNKGLGREEYDRTKELGLSLVTCGLYTFYLRYKTANSVIEIEKLWGIEPKQDAIMLTVLDILIMAFSQFNLNKVWEEGVMPGGQKSIDAQYQEAVADIDRDLKNDFQA